MIHVGQEPWPIEEHFFGGPLPGALPRNQLLLP